MGYRIKDGKIGLHGYFTVEELEKIIAEAGKTDKPKPKSKRKSAK